MIKIGTLIGEKQVRLFMEKLDKAFFDCPVGRFIGLVTFDNKERDDFFRASDPGHDSEVTLKMTQSIASFNHYHDVDSGEKGYFKTFWRDEDNKIRWNVNDDTIDVVMGDFLFRWRTGSGHVLEIRSFWREAYTLQIDPDGSKHEQEFGVYIGEEESQTFYPKVEEALENVTLSPAQ